MIIDEGPGARWPRSTITPSPWSGWPDEWAMPNWWGRVEELTDTAWACLDKNSSLLATMPPYLVGASPSLPDDWIDNPDPDLYNSWEEFARELFWDFQSGEAILVATGRYDNGKGRPARFHVAEPWTVNVEWVDGRRRYAIGGLDITDDVLHLRYKSSRTNARGHGPLEAGRTRLLAARMLTRYGANLAMTGAIPNAVLKHADELTAKQSTDLQQQWIEARLSSIGLPAVLSGGVTFETLQLSPKDMALVELLQFNESRIAILLGMPPFIVGLPSGGDSMTYTNVVSLFDYHWRAGLRPMGARVMSDLSGWLTPRGTRIEINRDEYVKPGPLERAQTWEILIRIGVLTAEQVQEIERYAVAAPSETLTSGVLQ